jgi:hypothetical protein
VRLRQQLPVRAAAGSDQLLLLRDDLRRDDMPFTLDDLLLVRAGWGSGYHVLLTGNDVLRGGQQQRIPECPLLSWGLHLLGRGRPVRPGRLPGELPDLSGL